MKTITAAALILLVYPAFAPAAEQADAAYEKLAAEAIDASVVWRPLDATGAGLHDYDGRLPDYSPAAIAAGTRRLENCSARLEAIDPAALSARNRYDRQIILAGLHRDLFWRRDVRCYARNPMVYVPDVAVFIQQNFAPPAERMKSVISIENALPGVLAAARANLDETLSRPSVEEAVRNSRGAADFLETDVVTAFRGAADAALQSRFRDSTKLAAGAFRAYSDFLKTEKLPKADQNFALGRQRYCKMLAGEMIALSPEELLALGTQELHREQDRFAAAGRAIDPHRKPTEIFAAMQHEHPSAENLIRDTAKNLEAIRQFLIDRDIVSVPSNVRAIVAETPPYQHSIFAEMVSPGPLEKNSAQAYYYVTPPEKNWSEAKKEEWLTSFNYYTTDVVSIHEAYPGHYVHGLHLREGGVTKAEALFTSYAFTEGWAHYCEQMLIDQGYGAGGSAVRAAKYRMAQSDEALLRICRLCVSIRMHCQGMTLDEATKFFKDNCYYEAAPARAEAVRGTFDPEYLYYTLGKLQFLKLREDYRKQEGAAYSLRKYHDAVLSHGTPPLRLLREQLLRDPKQWDAILDLETPSAKTTKETAARQSSLPRVSAKAWAIADGKTGKVLWGLNEVEPRAIASTTKIMTALLVVRLAEHDPKLLDEEIIFSERAAAVPGSSCRLRVGERLPLRELLYGMLLPSGNDAAVAVAEHFGPRFKTRGKKEEEPVKLFIAEMNRRAKELKLAQTSFLDPNGLARNQASARDLAVLTWTAMQNKLFREYVRTQRHSYSVAGKGGQTREVTWTNTNKLLGEAGYDGVKTGTTRAAGACLVASGANGGDRLIVVVFGASPSDARYTDARALFQWAWQQRAAGKPKG